MTSSPNYGFLIIRHTFSNSLMKKYTLLDSKTMKLGKSVDVLSLELKVVVVTGFEKPNAR